MENYYQILNIDKTYSTKEIKKAYAKLLRTYPPETCPEEFKKIHKAYEILINPTSRENYDALNEPDILYDEIDDIEDNYLSENNYSSESEPEITPETDYKIVLNLFAEYCDDGDYEFAINALNAGIDKTNIGCSNNIIYYLELIKVYINIKDLENSNMVLDELLNIIALNKESDAAKYVFNQLKILALDLFASVKFTYSRNIAIKLIDISPKDTKLKSLLKSLNQYQKCLLLLNELEHDSSVCLSLKILIQQLLNEEMDIDERKLALESAISDVEITDKKILIGSLQRLQYHYKEIYFAYYSDYFRPLVLKLKEKPFLSKLNWKILFFVWIIACTFIFPHFSQNEHPAHSISHDTSNVTNDVSNSILDCINKIENRMPNASIIFPCERPRGYIESKNPIDYISNKGVSYFSSSSFAKVYTKGSSKIKYFVEMNRLNSWKNDLKNKRVEILKLENGTFAYSSNKNEQQLLFKVPSNGTPENFLNTSTYDSTCIFYKITGPATNKLSKKDFLVMAKKLN